MTYALYIALSLSGLLSYVGVVASLGDATTPVVTVSLVFLAVTVLLARAAWLQDRIAFGKFLVGVLLFVAASSALPAFFGDDQLEGRITLAVSSALAVAGIVAIRHYAWRDSRGCPNLLAEMAGHEAIFEEAGVHFVVSQPENETSLQIGLQNCWDSPREVEIHVGEHRLNGGHLKIPPVPKLPLAALEVGLLTIPISVRTPGRHSLVLSVEVSGEGGTRRRSFRGHLAAKRVTPSSFLLHLAVGEIAWGGGMRVDLDCTQEQARGEEPGPPTWAQLFGELQQQP